MNNIHMIGHVGFSELKEVNDKKILNFSIALDESKKVNDEWITKTTWVPVTLFGDRAVRCSNIKKGDLLYCRGKLSIDTYTDDTGNKRKNVKVLGEYIRNLTPKKKETHANVMREVNELCEAMGI
jgi:single-strand DNA-binding protein